MILYFTGTGNSQYIAELIANRQEDEIVDAAKLIKAGSTPSFTSEKAYVFVAPTYAWRLPRVFKEWIQSCRFCGNQQAYFVLTCGGEIGAAGNDIEKFAKQKGFAYMGTAGVVMPENYLVMFDPTPEEEDEGIFRAAAAHTEDLCEQIRSGRPFDKVKIPFVGYLESGIVNSSFYTFYIGAKKFFATDACVSCGRCVENCMLNNISLQGGRPGWGKNCTHCMACICKCPANAIEYGKHTKGRRRYVCRQEGKK